MKRTAFKFAASTLIVSMTMTGFTGSTQAMRRFGEITPAPATRADRQAAQLYAEASRALQEGQVAQALTQMEQAVALSPRDAGYRLLLGDIYLKSGRFESARATYGDVLALDPANLRAGLNSALTLIALGRPQAAARQLEDLAGRAPPSDVGLAFALAGRTDRAIELLEQAARSPMATARVRQNLALALAIAGDWRRARAVAGQDLSSAELGPRLEQWAAFARPDSGPTQVAGLLGVAPSEDPGQPVRLALAPAAAAPDRAFAEAGPEPALAEAAPEPAYVENSYAVPPPVAAPASEPAPEPVPAPIQYAEAPPAEAPAFWVPTAQSEEPVEAPAPARVEAPVAVAFADSGEAIEAMPVAPASDPEPDPVQVRYAAAARSLVQPRAQLIRASAVSRTPAPIVRRAPPVARGSAPVVVQLGAFNDEGNAERAWLAAERRHGLGAYRPLTTTFNHQGRTFHRVSISGFASEADARRLCGAIRAARGACFVRGQAGDASIRWAARYAQGRNRSV